MANRHGLIAGATGTGKTVTLRTVAEQLSSAGVPVFMSDVKGDLSGLPFPGGDNPKVRERVQSLGLADFRFEGFPVAFWDVFGEQGHPVRTTVSEMGPLLMSRILMLNETQSGVLSLVYKIADDSGLLLLDLKDLRAMSRFVGDKADDYRTEYGHISPASIGAIQRNLLNLEQQGADRSSASPRSI
jgi:DNA helicase HerA-like ATPase